MPTARVAPSTLVFRLTAGKNVPLNVKKEEQRQNMQSMRSALPEKYKEKADKAIAEKLLSSLTFTHASIIASYWPVNGEVDLRPLMKELIDLGHSIALPCINTKYQPLSFREWSENTPMLEGKYGIPQPDPTHSKKIIPEVILVPMLAFDHFGHRLGYGGGFYDRTLAKLSSTHKILRIGIAYEAQKLDKIEASPYDISMNMVITDQQVHVFSKT